MKTRIFNILKGVTSILLIIFLNTSAFAQPCDSVSSIVVTPLGSGNYNVTWNPNGPANWFQIDILDLGWNVTQSQAAPGFSNSANFSTPLTSFIIIIIKHCPGEISVPNGEITITAIDIPTVCDSIPGGHLDDIEDVVLDGVIWTAFDYCVEYCTGQRCDENLHGFEDDHNAPKSYSIATPKIKMANPVSGEGILINYTLENNTEVFMSVYDLQGRQHMILRDGEEGLKGINTIKVNFNSLQPGSYLLELRTNSFVTSKLFIKLD